MSTRSRKVPPKRIRTYRVEAEPRTSPDLHKLAQLFIGMAFARADDQHRTRQSEHASPRQDDAGKV